MVYISFKRVKGFECEIHRNMKKINKIKKVNTFFNINIFGLTTYNYCPDQKEDLPKLRTKASPDQKYDMKTE